MFAQLFVRVGGDTRRASGPEFQKLHAPFQRVDARLCVTHLAGHVNPNALHLAEQKLRHAIHDEGRMITRALSLFHTCQDARTRMSAARATSMLDENVGSRPTL